MIDIKDPKIYTFKVGEDIYDVPEDQLENFKLKVPNAEEVKTNGVAETDASVTPEENMASKLDPGSLVSTDPKTKELFKKYSYLQVTVGLFLLGIILHRLFCVRTTIDKLLFQ